MKQCSRCQAENFQDQKFCSLCGRELTPKIVLDAHVPGSTAPREAIVPEKPRPEQHAYQHFLKAKEFIANRDLDSAIIEFKAALAHCPKDPMIERLLAKTLEAKSGTKIREPRPASKSPAGAVAKAGAASPPEAGEQGPGAAVPGSTCAPARPAVGRASPRVHGPPAQATVRPSSDITWPDLSSRPATSAPRSPPLVHHEPVHEHVSPPAKSSRITDLLVGKGSAATKPSAHTGRFLEVYSKTPTLSPALLLDSPSEDGIKEIAVSLLMVGAFLVFGFLLLL